MIAEPQKRNWQGGTTAPETRWGNALSREVHDIPGPIGYLERISCQDSERHLLKIGAWKSEWKGFLSNGLRSIVGRAL
jgi:hypothetical protein